MALAGRDSNLLKDALGHPIRIQIVALFVKDRSRSMAAKSLAADLVTFFPKVKVRQVAYHTAILRDAHLIPTACGAS